MNIIWQQNPLSTIIELDEFDKQKLYYETIIDEMQWAAAGMSRAHRDLSKKDFDLEYERLYEAKNSKRVEELLEYYIESLKYNHCGDCTCVPSSCSKCYAENLLEIDTIKGLGKHQASKIQGAFATGSFVDKTYNPNGRNINEALELLKNYDASDPRSDWQHHVERWNREAKEAYNWLLNYKQEHFSDI